MDVVCDKKSDSIEIYNATNHDILFTIDYPLNNDLLFLPKKRLIKFKPVDEKVMLVQSDKCIYFLTKGRTYYVKGIINGINRIYSKPKNNEEDAELNFFPAFADTFGFLRPSVFTMFKNIKNKSANLAIRERKIETDYCRQLGFLEEYTKKFNLSKEFYQQCRYILEILKYSNKTQVLERAHSIQELKDSINRWRNETFYFYKDSLATYLNALHSENGKFNVIDKDLIQNIEIIFLHDCFLDPGFNSDNLQYFEIKQEKSAQFFPGRIADFALTSNIIDCIRYRGEVPDSFLNRYKSLCNNQSYRNYVDGILEQKRIASDFKNSPDFLLMNLNGGRSWWKKIINSHQGRYIYVDFWASWCAPCRYEIPFSRMLAEGLQGKNIDFVYLSIDENKTDWKKAVLQENLQDSNKSYLIINPKGKYNARYYKINEIPRYIILDKKGSIINFDAPRPSSQEIKTILNKLANSN